MEGIKPKSVVIFDIDGTLSDPKKRLHYIQTPGKKDWNAFLMGCGEDSPIQHTIRIANLLRADGLEVVYLTAREEKFRRTTTKWLRENGCPGGILYMRADGDYRKATTVKREIFLERLAHRNVLVVFEDRDSVVTMWRSMGLNVYQVAEGAY